LLLGRDSPMTEDDLSRLLRAGLQDDAAPPGAGCPSDDALWGLATGTLPRPAHAAVRGHLGECGRCAAVAVRYCRAATHLRARQPRLRRRMAEIVTPSQPAPVARGRVLRRWAPALAAIAALLAIVFVWRYTAAPAGYDLVRQAAASADLRQKRPEVEGQLARLIPAEAALLRSAGTSGDRSG